MTDFTNDDRFDGLYMNVAQTAQGIEPLLDTVFSFLRRKTDFFNGPSGQGTTIAVDTVNSVLQKHVKIYEKQVQEKKAKEEAKRKKKEEARRKLEEKRAKAAAAASAAAATEATNSEKVEIKEAGVIELGSDGFDVSDSSFSTTSMKNQLSEDSKKPAAQDTTSTTTNPNPTSKSESESTTSNTNAKEDEQDKDEEDSSPAPIGNGGTVPGKYTWTQTLAEVNIHIPLPDNTRGRDLNVTIAKKHLKVGIKEQSPTLLINAPFTKSIICDDSFWTVEDGNRLVINLAKLNDMEWWDAVCQGDPTINIQKIQPENSKLDELDGETRQTVEKMMFDQRQKSLGLPTSEEQHKYDMLEKFKKAHPEMDFSNVKMT